MVLEVVVCSWVVPDVLLRPAEVSDSCVIRSTSRSSALETSGGSSPSGTESRLGSFKGGGGGGGGGGGVVVVTAAAVVVVVVVTP